ncbi:DNA-directed RNA polymerase III subunit RPC4 [Micractinium conductrix]|uniref:DNA-directed RNA polymerase III subunit RPC4 n=1 Tax=Micractinium conductrix TaxID=554055 RepID=A0A2P6UZX2_9CHLO|nr:DNA-directed RNA polymerase III subunit RPC4 [Micractinium conductrix]|eukprot:PSC67395.1 DNA-directed RNA polymerase III subunit RPC4 [Micractinium conductrix]
MPTNFSRPKALADSTESGAPSTSVSVASKSESAFEDLMKAAKSDAAWQRRGGRGAGRGALTGRSLTTFGGGAGDGGGAPGAGARRVWSSTSGGGRSGRGGGQPVKAGDRVKSEGVVKSEPGEEGKLEGVEEEGSEWAAAISEEDREEDGEAEQDFVSYEQYYPLVLPQREPGVPPPREPDDPTRVIPKDLFDLPENYQPMLEELGFLQDSELNDGRLMLFQLPSLLPIAAQSAAPDGAGTSVAASRPSTLAELPSSRIGKLLVFESGKVKLQMGDVLLDVDPGIPPRFRQDVAVVNPQSRQCVMLAPVALRMVCTPNLDTLLDPEAPLPVWEHAAAAPAASVGGTAADGAAAGGAAGGVAVRGRRKMVVDESDGEEAEAMEVDGEGAQNGAAPAAGQQQQERQPAAAGKQRQQAPLGVAIKKEKGEEEEV